MTSKDFIENIITTRGRHGIKEGYFETHHIIPKCLNGNNDDNNLIDLYAREHFEIHKLLAQENPHNKSLVCAYEGCVNYLMVIHYQHLKNMKKQDCCLLTQSQVIII